MKVLQFYDESTNVPESITIVSNSHEDKPEVTQKNQDISFKKYSELSIKGLKFVHLNIASLLKNIDELRSIVMKKQIHIFAFNETRLDDSIRSSEIEIPHYFIVRKDRNRSGGGVAIYIHESLIYSVLEHDFLSHLEAIPTIIRLKNTKPIIFINWYRPPNSKNEVFNYYDELISFASGFNCHLIMMGDTNCDILKQPLHLKTKNYNQIKNIYSMNQINTSKPTRIVNSSSSLIDHI